MFNSLSSIRILHVEDEVEHIELTRYFLKEMGGDDFKINSALSAEEALDTLSKESFDIIISDYKMPGMDGIEFLEALRRTGNDTPFIIFTGKGEEKVAMDALNKGANRYIVKGANPAIQCGELANSIREIVEKRKIRELLEEVKERYNRGLVEGIVELPWEMDILARFTYCGPQIKDKIGYEPEDVLNRTLFDFLLPNAKEVKKIRTLLENLARDPKPVEKISMKVLHKDGSIKKFETSVAPIFNKADRLVGFRGIMRDITRRKRDKMRIWKKE
ncbi:Methanogenesis regulatory protein FilR1 [ANME-1 cluster archaeon GoMg2]|nr:Methanogenesis regulatory protein FilR1 [ANME-1 cluster archaeon GoMg2]